MFNLVFDFPNMPRDGNALGEYKIHEILVLNQDDRAAKNVLSLAAKEVEPIMQKRQWKIKTLQEFFPVDGRFVGLYIKAESKIKLRLKHSDKDTYMYHYDFIIGSLLHELAHIRYSSHGKRFQNLLRSLKDEYNGLYCAKIETPMKINSTNKGKISYICIDSKNIIYEVEQNGCISPFVLVDISNEQSSDKKIKHNEKNSSVPIVIESAYNNFQTVKKPKFNSQEQTQDVIDVETYALKRDDTIILIEDFNAGETEKMKNVEKEQPKEQEKENMKKNKWEVPEDQIIVID